LRGESKPVRYSKAGVWGRKKPDRIRVNTTPEKPKRGKLGGESQDKGGKGVRCEWIPPRGKKNIKGGIKNPTIQQKRLSLGMSQRGNLAKGKVNSTGGVGWDEKDKARNGKNKKKKKGFGKNKEEASKRTPPTRSSCKKKQSRSPVRSHHNVHNFRKGA